MRVLRTPDECFDAVSARADWPWQPRWATTHDGLRVAYVDEGGTPGDPAVLLLHGEPTWGFLWRHVVRVLLDAGARVVVPDLVGFGRSDKPAEVADHTYARHVAWMRSALLEASDGPLLRDATLVCHDWGGLIGLRLVAEHPDRFARVVAANTGLPDGSFRMPDVWQAFAQVVRDAPHLDVGRLVQSGCADGLADDVRACYDAPFPTADLTAGPRAMPGLIPQSPDDPAAADNRAAWAALAAYGKPFLCAFSDRDPITAGADALLTGVVPGARDVPHVTIAGGGHFLQEDRGSGLGEAVVSFLRGTGGLPAR